MDVNLSDGGTIGFSINIKVICDKIFIKLKKNECYGRKRSFRMKKILEEILDKCRKHTKEGAVANYIPELAKANPDEFGISVMVDDGNIYSVGDSEKRFTMQSVASIRALELLSEKLDLSIF